MEKNIYSKLSKIQSELKVPKSQYSKFGEYNYRNCEDILEALKPMLKEVGAVITLADEIQLLGTRYYIKAMATLTDIDSKESITSTAYAREDEDRKKMDGSQLTGSASSYARKYALNGLFAIDDTKDSDYTNRGTETPSGTQTRSKAPKAQPKTKTANDYKIEFAQLLKVKGIPFTQFIDYLKENYKADKLDGLNINQLENLKKTISAW